jgi:hypothetical protein
MSALDDTASVSIDRPGEGSDDQELALQWRKSVEHLHMACSRVLYGDDSTGYMSRLLKRSLREMVADYGEVE